MLFMFSSFYSLGTLLYGVCHLWFLLMLFGLFVLAPILWHLLESIKNDRMVTVVVAASFLLYPLFWKVNILQLTKVFYFLPFFLIGYIIQRRGKNCLYQDSLFWISLISVIFILFVLCPRPLFIDKVVRDFASFIVIIVVSLIPNITISNKQKGILKNLSDNSMGVYLIHHVIISYVVMLPSVKKVLDANNCYIGVFVLFLSVFSSSWLLSILFNKYNVTRFLIGSKI